MSNELHQLAERIAKLEERTGNMDVRQDEMAKDVKQLLALANQGEGSLKTLWRLGLMAGGVAAFFASCAAVWHWLFK